MIFVDKRYYFHKGAPTPPQGHWIVAPRFQSSQILGENIDE